ncbi:hypothetical protein G9A89_007137 [Geosiphon pyriformis]|nr:hypothetical protein G9A89_007137 [Geosiphon pyriformis]
MVPSQKSSDSNYSKENESSVTSSECYSARASMQGRPRKDLWISSEIDEIHVYPKERKIFWKQYGRMSFLFRYLLVNITLSFPDQRKYVSIEFKDVEDIRILPGNGRFMVELAKNYMLHVCFKFILGFLRGKRPRGRPGGRISCPVDESEDPSRGNLWGAKRLVFKCRYDDLASLKLIRAGFYKIKFEQKATIDFSQQSNKCQKVEIDESGLSASDKTKFSKDSKSNNLLNIRCVFSYGKRDISLPKEASFHKLLKEVEEKTRIHPTIAKYRNKTGNEFDITNEMQWWIAKNSIYGEGNGTIELAFDSLAFTE